VLPALEHLGPFCHLVFDQGLGRGEGFGFSLWHVVNVLRALTEREMGAGGRGREGGREGGRGGGVKGGGEREKCTPREP